MQKIIKKNCPHSKYKTKINIVEIEKLYFLFCSVNGNFCFVETSDQCCDIKDLKKQSRCKYT